MFNKFLKTGLILFFAYLFFNFSAKLTFAAGTFGCKVYTNADSSKYCDVTAVTCQQPTPNAGFEWIFDNGTVRIRTCWDASNNECADYEALNHQFDCIGYIYPSSNPSSSTTTGTGSTGTGDSKDVMVSLNQVLADVKFPSDIRDLGSIISKLLKFIYPIAGVGLLVFLIYGGFAYLTSAGDPKKMEAAKGIITTAIIGFIIVIIAFWVTEIINYIFNLKIPLS